MNDNTAKIRALNDAHRTNPLAGGFFMTSGVSALPPDVVAKVLHAVQTHTKFTADDDPHGEHDFGSFCVGDEKFFWKIDYYDAASEEDFHSPDAADPAKTRRVLMIMLRAEY